MAVAGEKPMAIDTERRQRISLRAEVLIMG